MLFRSVPANSNCSRTPYTEDSWRITVDGETKTFTWSGESCSVTNDAQQLLGLRTFIQRIAAGKDAYKELPEAEGGYD